VLLSCSYLEKANYYQYFSRSRDGGIPLREPIAHTRLERDLDQPGVNRETWDGFHLLNPFECHFPLRAVRPTPAFISALIE
jgi:hypothetical protein